jgi:hypothetical protein
MIAYDTALGPLRQTATRPATAICFHWLPADYECEAVTKQAYDIAAFSSR